MFWLLLILLLVGATLGLEYCANNQVCPVGNTCCKGGCIPLDLGALNATCCNDGLTGCGVGYECRDEEKNCVATVQVTDPLVQTLPRYRLCHPHRVLLETVRGFPIDSVNKLAYYSSHGDVTRMDMTEIDFVFVFIHGAGRNADDYFCVATAAVELQTTFQNVLVVVPRYASVEDGPIMLREGGTALRWSDKEISGTWRYGARSVHPIQVSSFTAMDLLVETLLIRTRANIVIAGHSSGGQFVQRWSLLTSVWSDRLRAIVANPSSYAYLTHLRKVEQEWKVPCMTKCPKYNQWEWGLDHGGDLDTMYKDDAMKLIGNNSSTLIERFRDRNILYMAGSQDRCNVSMQNDGWCSSHGLETSCMDEFQGKMRWERHFNYLESLKLVGITTHRRLTVDDVGHDHSLMFTRPESIAALFGDTYAVS